MVLLTLSALCFLSSVSATALTDCQKLNAQSSGLIGSYTPQCSADGSFESMQCWASTGYCWCVDQNGAELVGTKVRGKADCSVKGKLSTCQIMQSIIVNLPGWCGPPRCKDDGSFEETQCCASTGECYCVDRDGTELEGTRQKGQPDCEATHSKCEVERLDALSHGQLVGQFIPHCIPDGSYNSVQCWASTGYCWCVDKSGVKVDGTEIRGSAPNC
ncbi:equistatin-like [Nematostella vectensis]|uniref:equistatin-like n=1 Tax=Nematostella vectensis TaxID=45351 RepID=UPI00207756C3|nr:equistatin-like [Nematostella vectensis]